MPKHLHTETKHFIDDCVDDNKNQPLFIWKQIKYIENAWYNTVCVLV